MKYRIVYTNNKVIECIESLNLSVTSSNSNFIIDTLDNALPKLLSENIDVSFLWKNGFIPRFSTNSSSPEITISSHDGFKRKAFFKSLFIDYQNKYFSYTVIVRHYLNENYNNETHDDFSLSKKIDNSVIVKNLEGDDRGEFDFFLELINSGIPITTLQQMRIPLMDSKGMFNQS